MVFSRLGWYQIPLAHSRGWFPAICCTTWWWNLPRTLPIWGVATHASNPKSRTEGKMARYKRPDIRLSDPSRPSILNRRDHICSSFYMLPMTYVQSSPVVVSIIHRYHKGIIVSRVWPCDLKEVSSPAWSSSSTSLRCLCSTPLV